MLIGRITPTSGQLPLPRRAFIASCFWYHSLTAVHQFTEILNDGNFQLLHFHQMVLSEFLLAELTQPWIDLSEVFMLDFYFVDRDVSVENGLRQLFAKVNQNVLHFAANCRITPELVADYYPECFTNPSLPIGALELTDAHLIWFSNLRDYKLNNLTMLSDCTAITIHGIIKFIHVTEFFEYFQSNIITSA